MTPLLKQILNSSLSGEFGGFEAGRSKEVPLELLEQWGYIP